MATQSRGQTFHQACAALEPGSAQDRHRSIAQLSGGKSGDPGTCERHLLRASLYRKHLAARFVAWREVTEVTQNPSYAF